MKYFMRSEWHFSGGIPMTNDRGSGRAERYAIENRKDVYSFHDIMKAYQNGWDACAMNGAI